MMLFVYLGALCAIIVIIVIISTKIKASKFNDKVKAYSDRHVHKVLVNHVYDFIAIDVNSQELTYITPKKQIEFTRDQIAEVKIVEKETPGTSDPGGPEEYKVDVLIVLRDHPVKTIKINCVQSSTRGSFLYEHGCNVARAIDDAMVKAKNGII
jgi:hypothetical protein